MATSSPVAPGEDLSTLSWVHAELRRSLEAVNKALRRYLKEAEAAGSSDLDSVDPSVLRQARSHLHQSVGALELVGLGSAAQLLRAAEAALQRLSARPRLITPAAVEAIERGSFALLDYIGRLLVGKPVASIALFPQYRDLQELAGASRVHPADLWASDWQWRELAADAAAPPCHPDAVAINRAEAGLLALMRATPDAAARMAALFSGLGNAASGRLATLWRLAAGFFEAQADGLLRVDLYSKRLASRLLAQMHAGEAAEPSDRLAQDLLFFCAQAVPPPGRTAGPRLAAVRSAYALPGAAPADYEAARLGRFDPALISQARKRVAAAKEVWSAVAAGEMARAGGLAESFALVTDSLQRLYPDGATLGRALHAAASAAATAGREPAPALAMEVATGLLYVDASLDEGDFDQPEMAPRVARLAQRVDQVRQGQDPGALDLWMEELYRQVSDRQTMGSVVQELRSSLSEVEKQIDQYFRNPAQRELLIPVPAQLSAMRGVLSVLGMDQASQAVVRMRDDVDVLANTEVDPEYAASSGTFNHLADNLGALSFLIDMVSVQPQLAKSLFRFDAASGRLEAVMARAERSSGAPAGEAPVLAQQAQTLALAAAQPDADGARLNLELARLAHQARAADQTDLAEVVSRAQSSLASAADDTAVEAARHKLAESISNFVAAQAEPAPALPQSRPVPPPSPPVAPGQTGLEDDVEMRDIFLEEAREVLDGARAALADLQSHHEDLGAMTTVRRAFHTLKGSSRMVGLSALGEAAWACEQLYNGRLADGHGADADLREFSREAFDYFEQWVDAVAAGDASAFHPDAVAVPAETLRTEARRLPVGGAAPVGLPEFAAENARVATLGSMVPDLPSALDLELPTLPELPAEATEPIPVAAAVEVDSAEAFDLLLPESQASPPQAAPGAMAPPWPAEELSIDLAALEDAELVSSPAELSAADAAAPLPLPDEADHAFDLLLPDLPEPVAVPEITAVAVSAESTAMTTLVEPSQVETALPEPTMVEPTLVESAPAAPEVDLADAISAAGSDATTDAESEQFKQIGPLRISIALFNIYLNEADELSRRLATELAEWSLELHRPVGDTAAALAHSLAGNSATVGYADLSQLSRALEHALEWSQLRGSGQAGEAALFVQAGEEIRRLLHQFAAGFLPEVDGDLVRALQAMAQSARQAPPAETSAEPAETTFEADALIPGSAPEDPTAAPALDESATELLGELGRPALMPFAPLSGVGTTVTARADALDDEDDIDVEDMLDEELFPIFEEEAGELLPQLQSRLREWTRKPDDAAAASACMRTLHTLKGGARLAGAMRMGEMVHRLETAIEHLLAGQATSVADIEQLVGRADAIEGNFDQLRSQDLTAPASEPALAPAVADLARPAVAAAPPPPETEPAMAAPAKAAAAPFVPAAALPGRAIDWQRFGSSAAGDGGRAAPLKAAAGLAAAATVRVRSPLLDRLVNHAGEVSITRARLESDVSSLKASLGDLTDNLERLRSQLRDIELQAETQIGTRMEAARAAAQQFDPLEMDRFTRFQELTRMMAESVSDVATVQRGLQRGLQSAEDELARQARLTRDMQEDLLRTRMVEFEGLSERLYRVVRQAAKETGKQVKLDIIGGSIEVDRGVLDRMTASFEHLLRNGVAHGIEAPEARQSAGKEPAGTITIAVSHEGNEVAVEFRDDGAGLDLARIRDKALSLGLLAAGSEADEGEIANLIFQAGFSTADEVTGLAGRGVGMDVVRADVNAMGGRIETSSARGQGTSFKLVLPLTTAVTQVVMVRCGELTVAVPSTLVEVVLRVRPPEMATAYASGVFRHGERELPFSWLGALLQGTPRGLVTGRTAAVVVIRSAQQRVVLHVDEVLGNQEVVVKNLGPQLSRLPGLAGMTLLPSGLPALIYNPVALVTLYGERARAATLAALRSTQPAAAAQVEAKALAPLVLVVDDSLTVRRVTQRLLEREGYRVVVAKDGLEGLERLADELPLLVLTDIEMPRMDGFDLVRNMRVDPRLSGLPVVMITSRIAQKHRDYAAELGVEHYLGKPYAEDALLALVAQYALRPLSA